MTDLEKYQKLRQGLRVIRFELRELLEVLSTNGTEIEDKQESPSEFEEVNQDFFEQIVRSEQSPVSKDLYKKVLTIITNMGYASTLVLQTKLEINYRQAVEIVADLERDGLVERAHGFRPHKVLPTAYMMRDRIEG